MAVIRFDVVLVVVDIKSVLHSVFSLLLFPLFPLFAISTLVNNTISVVGSYSGLPISQAKADTPAKYRQ